MPTPVTVSPAQLAQLSPHCLTAYRDGFGMGGRLLGLCGIAHSDLRMAHFMAQILHESGALTVQFENFWYSGDRLAQVWPGRFKPLGPLEAEDYAYDEEKLANEVYGGRMGNSARGDGYTYRGRGLLQLTGKDSYAKASRLMRAKVPEVPDFSLVPDAVLDSAWCVGVAAAEWEAKGCNEAADSDDLGLVTQRINGGSVGLERRRAWLLRTRALWKC